MHGAERSIDEQEHSVPTIHGDRSVVRKRVELGDTDGRGVDSSDLVPVGTVATMPLSFHGTKKRLSEFTAEVLGEYFKMQFWSNRQIICSCE